MLCDCVTGGRCVVMLTFVFFGQSGWMSGFAISYRLNDLVGAKCAF